jgi:hypothetical protein
MRVDKSPYKIYNLMGMIISECPTMEEAIVRAKLHNCEWKRSPGKEVGQWI